MTRLNRAHVAVYGLGGVGGFAAEALVRSGIGELSIIDFDRVDETNINRQIIATTDSIGQIKVELMEERLLSINPQLKLHCYENKYTAYDRGGLNEDLDFVIDAIDMVSSKLDLLEQCVLRNINVVSSMGMGNKLDPSKIKLADLSNTRDCPLAKVIRRELGRRGIKNLMTVYSTEKPIKPTVTIVSSSKREVPGSCSFVPSVAGLFMAGYVVRKLANIDTLA